MVYSVLLLGATGYLGGDILTRLEQADNYDITCVVRPEREACLSERKVTVLVVRPVILLEHSELQKAHNH